MLTKSFRSLDDEKVEKGRVLEADDDHRCKKLRRDIHVKAKPKTSTKFNYNYNFNLNEMNMKYIIKVKLYINLLIIS